MEEDLPDLEEGAEATHEELMRREIDDMSEEENYEPSSMEKDGVIGGAGLRAVHFEGNKIDSPILDESKLTEECKPMEVKKFYGCCSIGYEVWS